MRIALAVALSWFIVASSKAAPPKKPKNETCTPLAKAVDGVTATAKIAGKDGRTLMLSGRKPHMGTTVRLKPVTYIRQPEYWQVNVVECSAGPIRLPAIEKYKVKGDVGRMQGTKGVSLVFADGKTIKIDIPAKKPAEE